MYSHLSKSICSEANARVLVKFKLRTQIPLFVRLPTDYKTLIYNMKSLKTNIANPS